MKPLFLFLLFLLSISSGYAQTISADSISKYEGKTVTVCEKVIGTYITSGDSKTIMLNFGHPYPAQTFTGVIFQSDRANFSYDPATYLKDKMVCVTGEVKMYKGRPEIIIKKPDQLTIK